MKLKICHLYPDVLNLYGDVGNIICMKKRLEWRGIDVSVTPVKMGEELDASAFDLIFIGSGREDEQLAILDDLHSRKAAALRAAAENGVTILAIGGGFELLGKSYKSLGGTKYDFAGVLDMSVQAGKERFTGNYIFSCPECGDEVAAFENHSGRTYLGQGLQPLGSIVRGQGNNGSDGTEGARYKNVFGSYGHGSLLPKNPALCDLILKTALEHKYGSVELEPLNDSAENTAREYMLERLSK